MPRDLTQFENDCILAARGINPNLDASWRPYIFQIIANGTLVTGCNTTVYKTGKKAGRVKYLKDDGALTFVMAK